MKRMEYGIHAIIVFTLLFMSITLFFTQEIKTFLTFTTQSIILMIIFYGLVLRTSAKIHQAGYRVKTIIESGFLTALLFILFEIIEAISYQKDFYLRYYRISSIWNAIYNRDFIYIEHGRILLTFILTIVAAMIYGLFKHMDYSRKAKIWFFTIFLSLCLGGSSFIVTILIQENFIKRQSQPVIDQDQSSVQSILDQSKGFTTISDILSFYSLTDKPTLVTFWTNGCGSMKHALLELEKIKREIGPINLNFLYLNGEYKDPISDIRMMNRFIESNDISGYHIHLSRRQFHRILIDDYGITRGVAETQSLLFNRNMELIQKDIPAPYHRNALKDTLLKYGQGE